MTTPSSRSVSVVIPTRNEERNIPVVLEALPAYIDEVVLVDASDTEATVEAARRVRPDVRVVRQGRRGKGNALAAGFAAAEGDYVVMLDADGSMDPAEIERFVSALDQGAGYAKGSRYLAPGGSDDLSRLRDAGNRALGALVNVFFRSRHSDLCYGYNAFRRETLSLLQLPDPYEPATGSVWGDGFEVETLMTLRMDRAGVPTLEVPSFEHQRLHGQSNLRTFRDGSASVVDLRDAHSGARSGRSAYDHDHAGTARRRAPVPPFDARPAGELEGEDEEAS